MKEWYEEMCSKCKCYNCVDRWNCQGHPCEDGTCSECVVVEDCSDYEKIPTTFCDDFRKESNEESKNYKW